MLTGYLRQRRRTLLAFFLFGGIFAAAFALYQLPLRAVAYPFVLCAAAGAVLLALRPGGGRKVRRADKTA